MKAENWRDAERPLRKNELNKKLVGIITDDLLDAYENKDLYLFNFAVTTALHSEEMFDEFFRILNPFVDEMENLYEAFSWYNVQLGGKPLPKVKKPTVYDMFKLLEAKDNEEEFNRICEELTNDTEAE